MSEIQIRTKYGQIRNFETVKEAVIWSNEHDGIKLSFSLDTGERVILSCIDNQFTIDLFRMAIFNTEAFI